MNLINNRYKIIRNIGENESFTTFLVYDLLRYKAMLNLNIIKASLLLKISVSTISKEFDKYMGISIPGIGRDLEIERIFSIDEKPVCQGEYYFISEYIEGNYDIEDFLANSSVIEILEGFIQICQTVNYLHLKGFTYGELTPDNIVIDCSKEGMEVVLKDIASTKIKSFDTQNGKNIAMDMHFLRILLLMFCTKNADAILYSYSEMQLEQYISQYKAKEKHNQLFNMLSAILMEEYNSVFELVGNINKACKTEFTSFNINELSKLNLNSEIIGMGKNIKEVMKFYYQLYNEQDCNKFIYVCGDSGVGKTRFLHELKHIFELRNVPVYSYFELSNSFRKLDSAFYEILEKVIGSSKENYFEKYSGQLIKLFPEKYENKTVTPHETLSSEEEWTEFLREIEDLFSLCNKNTSVFIIDDIDKADDICIEIFKYLFTGKNKNMIFIFSGRNKLLMRLEKDYLEIELNKLSQIQTKQMISSVIGSNQNSADDIGDRVYSQTLGNQLYIKELLKYLKKQGTLAINKESGKWELNKKYPMPLNYDAAIHKEMDYLEAQERELLTKISVFNIPLPERLVYRLVDTETAELAVMVDKLQNEDLINRIEKEQNAVYSFKSSTIKNNVYENIEYNFRCKLHYFAAKLLISDEHCYYMCDEITWHLCKAEKHEEAVDFSIEASAFMEKIKLYNIAVRILANAYTYLGKVSCYKKRAEVIKRLGSLNIKKFEWKTSINYLLEADSLAKYYLNLQEQVDILDQLALCYRRIGENKASLDTLEEAKIILQKFDYLEGEIKINIGFIYAYYHSGQKEKAFILCDECLLKCPDNLPGYKGSLYRIMGMIQIALAKPEEALKAFEISYELLKKSDKLDELIEVLNNMAVIYDNYYNDHQKSINCLKDRQTICIQNKLLRAEMWTQLNIGNVYITCLNYMQALNCYENMINKIKIMRDQLLVNSFYNSLSYAYLKVYEYKKSYDYFMLQSYDESLKNKEHQMNLGAFYTNIAEMYYEFGDFKTSSEYTKKAIELLRQREDLTRTCMLINNCIKVLQGNVDKEALQKCFDNTINIANRIEILDEGVNLLCEYAITLVIANQIDEVKAIENDIEAMIKNKIIKVNLVMAKILYLRSICLNGKEKEDVLNEALSLAKNEKKLEELILVELGDYYFTKKNYAKALSSYLAACDIIKNLTNQLPEQYQLSYFNSKHLIGVFKRVAEINLHYDKKYIMPDIFLNNCVNDISEFKKIFDFSNYANLIENKYFVKALRNIQVDCESKSILTIEELTANLTSDSIYNLKIIVSYLTGVTFAKRGLIIFEDEEGVTVLAASDNDLRLPEKMGIIEKARLNKTPILVNKLYIDYSYDYSEIPESLKALMCIPIKVKQTINTTEDIVAYFYFETDNLLNNFTQRAVEECGRLINLTSFTIEQHKLKINSITDKLTGTLNRKFLEQAINDYIRKASRDKSIFSIIMFDLDNFKSVNDKFGHLTGDYVLKKVCSVIKENIRKEDVIGRYGGEEFIIILPSATPEQALMVGEKLRIKIEYENILKDQFPVTLSMGIAAYPKHAEWKNQLIEKADQALYVAKEIGKNRCRLWNTQIANKNSGTNKLAGVVTGNTIEDTRHVLAMIEIIELVKQDRLNKDKIYDYLGKILEITEAKQAVLFRVENNVITETYARKLHNEQWTLAPIYNKKLVDSVISQKKGVNIIDWDNVTNFDVLTEIPYWDSVVVIPVIDSENTIGILYVNSEMCKKEFKADDYNYINVLGGLAAPILK